MDPGAKTDIAGGPSRSMSLGKITSNGNHGKGTVKTSDKDNATTTKRRCVSTACIACRRRKSKCDGNLPKCAACASVYLTECEYAPHTDHRRKGVYKKDTDNLRTKNSALQTLIHALLNYAEDDAFELLRQIRTCDNLEELAQSVEIQDREVAADTPDSPIYGYEDVPIPQFEAELSSKMGDLVIDGSVKFIGGTSNLRWLNSADAVAPASPSGDTQGALQPLEEGILGWTNVTKDKDLILHFMNMYFCWHYAYFTTLSKELFYRDFLTGKHSQYCSSLLVNVMLALGCHFSTRPEARGNSEDSATTGDHFFAEAKRRLYENDEIAEPKLCTIQALALMSVREAGCGREGTGWVYSGMSFRMASDLGLDVDMEPIINSTKLSDEEIDARRITFWGCFLFDKCWSNYLGRQPQLLLTSKSVRKPDVFSLEDSEMWSPYTDSGIVAAHNQPARTRAVALQIFELAEISSDVLSAFYSPQSLEKPAGKQAELKRLSDIHTRLEAWKKELPAELEPKDGQLPQVLLMHMFYQLLYIHLYRPFLKYTKATSPLPAHVSPRKFCTQAAGAISKLFRLYKRTHGLRQICNIAVYIAHSACTIHLLNLPEKNARRDIIHGVKQLEEIGECWTCARRTLQVLGLCAEKWRIELPEEVHASLMRTRQRWGSVDLSPAAHSPETTISVPVAARSINDTSGQTTSTRGFSPQTSVTPTPAIQATLGTSPMQLSETMQSSLEMAKIASRLKPLAHLTKEQQDAWNAHQSRMATFANRSQNSSSGGKRNAATLFGGVDSLMEEPQDWWLQDQSQLALGFDNWNSPATDWSYGSNGAAMPLHDDNTMTSPASSTQFFGNDITNNPFNTIPSPNQGSYGFGATQHAPQIQHAAQQHVQQYSRGQSQQRATMSQHVPNFNGGHQTATNGVSHPNARKRISTFDDESLYY